MSERVIKGYHAHIYYDPKTTRDAAAKVRAGLAQFNVQLGSWHDEAVGPHLDAMYQAVFTQEEFAQIVPWLMLHREGLSVLVHPSTGDGYGDHMERSLWLGDRLKLNEVALTRGFAMRSATLSRTWFPSSKCRRLSLKSWARLGCLPWAK